MPLAAGDKLGPYEIMALLGAGGMGEVYRARDTKLKRDVALKVLPDSFAANPDRMARFQREAEVLASLNHPNIAQIYGLEERALVMELVEGDSPKGPLPFEEAWKIAGQIAAGLEYAHEKGIVHRDLKPANIKVTPGGVVKLLDFGLAKAFTAQTPVSGNLENSPTLTLGATQVGVILGTAAYMAPEQAKGKAVDKRADIWSFGAVLYELLTGERLFAGDDVSDTLAQVLTKQPNLEMVSARARHLLRECLAKDPKRRLRDIGDAERLLLEEAAPASPAADAPSQARLAAGSWIAAGLMTAVAAALAFAHFREKPPAAEVVPLQIVPPERSAFTTTVVLSPDGRKAVFDATGPNGLPMLWIRSFDSLEARPLAGTESSLTRPFWSPDSRFIGFVSGFPSKLKKIEATGGAPQTLCDFAGNWFGGTWNSQGTILFSNALGGIFRVSEGGGTAVPVTAIDASHGEIAQAGPAFLPDGQHFLYLRVSNVAGNGGIYVGSLGVKPEQQSVKRLLSSDSDPVYAPSPQSGLGEILFLREGSLVAQPFDTRRMELTGASTSLAEDIGSTLTYGWFSASAGALAFRSGRSAAINSQLIWFDRQGKETGRIGPPSEYNDVQLSPDGKSIFVDKGNITSGIILHIWVVDVARGVFRRLIPGEGSDYSGVFSPDGSLVFTFGIGGPGGDIYRAPLSGAGMPELLFKSPLVKHPNDISRDGRFLLYDEHHPARQQDLYVLPLAVPAGQERKPIPFLVTPADETFAQFSPDGKWVAYSSDESGRREVYVQGFAPDHVPAAAVGKWLISSAGGDKPRWSQDGKEIYYIALNGKVMAVPVKTSPSFDPGAAVPLFDAHTRGFSSYAVAADGRFLINTASDAGEAAPNSSPVTVVLNWETGLKN